MSDSAPASVLTPSEVVFLARDQFAPPAGRLSRYTSSGIAIKASLPELAQHAYAVAFLALEQAEVLSLNLRSKKTLFGLRTVDALYADPAGSGNPFPAHSLESRLHQGALALSPKEQHEVWQVVYGLWSRDGSNPFGDAVTYVQELMATRGVLTSTSTKRLKILTVVTHAEPEAAIAAAAAQVGEVQALAQACQAARPDIWSHLVKDIAKGIGKHEKDDSPDFDD